MIRAEEVRPGSFIKHDGNVFTVRYCYYNHENRQVSFDLESGKVKLSPYLDNTSERITYSFDDNVTVAM